MDSAGLANYQQDFIHFLVHCEALTFGDFVTKSGRKTPYFVNTGRFNTGAKIAKLGLFYAEHIMNHSLEGCTTIFGPAYKGVPLCVTTAMSLATKHHVDIGFTFNRKEEKTHGDKGVFVGHQLKPGDDVIIVEDVVTAGTTLKEIVPLLRENTQVNVRGVVVSVDRCERGSGTQTAIDEVRSLLDLAVYPIVTIHGIRSYLSHENPSGVILSTEMQDNIDRYLEEYGA
ncbi:MAG: orotate phosphoribosyltransferase [Bdellovibrionales bacterium]|nr:orotate phosphoribosyltransferase [Bdellovibrionales bacterium]